MKELLLLSLVFSFSLFSQKDEKECIKAAHKIYGDEMRVCNSKKGEERKTCVKESKDKLDKTRKECSETKNKS